MNIKRKSLLTVLFFGAVATAPLFAQDLQSGLKDLESERFTKAGQTFTQLASSSPTADNQFYLGYYYLKTNQIDQAQAAFQKGLQADPKNQLNNIGLGAVALAKGDRATAKATIDEALKKTKNKNMDVLLRAGEVYTMFEKNSDPAEALRILDIADKLDKKNENAQVELALGDAYFSRNDGGNAVTKFENALAISPNLAGANYKIGKIFLRGKNYKKAQEYYEKAIANDPEFAPTYNDLAEAFFGSRAYKTAARNMDTYIQKSGTTDPEMILRSAQFDFLAQDYQKATAKLDQLKGKVNNPVIDRIYGWAYSGMGKNQEAVESLNRFIQSAPDRVIYDDYKYLGRAYGQLGNPEGDSLSLVYLEKAAAQDTTENLYREVGKAYYEGKKFEKAIEAYNKAVAYDTTKATTNDYFQLGYSNFLLGNRIKADGSTMNGDSAGARQARAQYFAAADNAFAKVSTISPDWTPGYYYRALANYYANPSVNNAEAVPYYEKYIEMANKEIAGDASKLNDATKKNLISAYKFLYAHHSAKNDEAKAKQYLDEIAKLDPNDPALKATQEAPKAAPAKPATKAPAKKKTA